MPGAIDLRITFITNPTWGDYAPVSTIMCSSTKPVEFHHWHSECYITPVVLIFIFVQKYIVSGLTNGAVKGDGGQGTKRKRGGTMTASVDLKEIHINDDSGPWSYARREAVIPYPVGCH